MEHIFTQEQEEKAVQILQSLRTAREAAKILLGMEDDPAAADTVSVLDQLLTVVEEAAAPYHERCEALRLPDTCRSARGSLLAACGARRAEPDRYRSKLQFELIPILEEAYMCFYYWTLVYGHPDREKRYYEEEIYELSSNAYANEALESGRFKYDVSFLVLAYNKLDYTKRCMDSLLSNMPNGLNYELILWDNGSTDGTAAYFESLHPTKLFESRINYAAGFAPHRAVEGEFLFTVSNDIVILPGTIENMLSCIRSSEDIAWVVPTTPNVSNLQTVPAQYQNASEMEAFALKNNRKDPYRWEQRVRLCDPIAVRRMLLTSSRRGVCTNGYINRSINDFPDDRMSLLLRRAGYRMMLAKDAYCHHFGSVTLQNEVEQYNAQKFYAEGRENFYRWFRVDPWGTGFCYDAVFMDRVVSSHTGHTEVLGINCGFGSNSLKIKEQLKEYCHNTDCTLTNITDDLRYLADLKGLGEANHASKLKDFKVVLGSKQYTYIVWEEPFLAQQKFKTLLELCLEHLTPDGALLVKLTEQTRETILRRYPGLKEPGNGWIMVKRDQSAG